MCSFLKLFIVLCILELNLSNVKCENKWPDLRDHTCDSCDNLNRNCKIPKGPPGYKCNDIHDLFAIIPGYYKEPLPQYMEVLEKCIPLGLVLTARMTSFCCTWSEITGCTLLNPSDSSANCNACTKNKTNLLGSQERFCPCESKAYINLARYGIITLLFALTLIW